MVNWGLKSLRRFKSLWKTCGKPMVLGIRTTNVWKVHIYPLLASFPREKASVMLAPPHRMSFSISVWRVSIICVCDICMSVCALTYECILLNYRYIYVCKHISSHLQYMYIYIYIVYIYIFIYIVYIYIFIYIVYIYIRLYMFNITSLYCTHRMSAMAMWIRSESPKVSITESVSP